MMYLLLKSLQTAFEEELKTLPMRTRPRSAGRGTACICAPVFIGALPPKTTADAYIAPAVVLQPMEGHGDEQGMDYAVVTVRLIVWNDESPEAGENDLSNMMAALRRRFKTYRTAALAQRFIATADESGRWAPWRRPDEQVSQFFEAYFLTHWTMAGF